MTKQACAKRKQHTQPWLPTTKECATFTHSKMNQTSSPHNTEKIRNTCSNAAHTGSASTWDITILQCPNMLTPKWKLPTEPHVVKSNPEHCRLLDRSFSKPQFHTNWRSPAILQQAFKVKSFSTAAITSQHCRLPRLQPQSPSFFYETSQILDFVLTTTGNET